ncbi:MAG: crossover junction endodeoxyribonuclease RuvC [Patescibacteria group bacterium]
MRVIGIDPGIERTGFAVLEMAGGKTHLLDFGRIFTDKKDPFSHRLNTLSCDLKRLLKKWKPDAAGIEEVFFSKNVKTAIKVSHARGVILETLEEHGIAIYEFNPAHVKMTVTGDGRADKFQVKKMVKCLLGIDLKRDDTADAIACGLATIATYNSQLRIK